MERLRAAEFILWDENVSRPTVVFCCPDVLVSAERVGGEMHLIPEKISSAPLCSLYEQQHRIEIWKKLLCLSVGLSELSVFTALLL